MRGGGPSVPLPPLHGQQGWLPQRRIGHGGCFQHTAPVRARALPPVHRPKGPPRVGLVPWRAFGGPNGQAWGSISPRRPPVMGPQACMSGLAEVMGEVGGFRSGGAWDADAAACLVWFSAPGVTAPWCTPPAAFLGGRGGGLASRPCGFGPGPAWRAGAGLRGPCCFGESSVSCRLRSVRRGSGGGGVGHAREVRSPRTPPGPPYRSSVMPLVWQLRIPGAGVLGAGREG